MDSCKLLRMFVGCSTPQLTKRRSPARCRKCANWKMRTFCNALGIMSCHDFVTQCHRMLELVCITRGSLAICITGTCCYASSLTASARDKPSHHYAGVTSVGLLCKFCTYCLDAFSGFYRGHGKNDVGSKGMLGSIFNDH